MKAILHKTFADLRRRKLQSAIILLVVALSSFAGTLALSLLVEINGPFDRAFAHANGAHLVMTFDSRTASLQQVSETASLSVVSQASGPYREMGVGVDTGNGQQSLGLQGRDRPDEGVNRLTIDSGRWMRSASEAVISSGLAHHGMGLGTVLTPDSASGIPSLTVVGIATGVADHVDAWVLPEVVPAQIAAPVGGKPAGQALYTMYYRLRHSATDSDVTAATNAIAAALPHGSIVSSRSYLEVKRQATITEAVMIPFLLALSIFALFASALVVANVVSGAVISGMRDLGIMKSVGFTPGQVTAVLLGQVMLPAVVGVVVGVPLGISASQPLIKDAASGFGLPAGVAVAPEIDLLCLVGVLAIVALAAFVPSVRAGRVPAAQVIATAGSPRKDHISGLDRVLARLPLSRAITLGLSMPFARPLRSMITLIAVLLGVASLCFVSGLQQSLQMVASSLTRTDQVQAVVHRNGSTDAAVSNLIANQSGTSRFVAEREADVTVQGLGQPVQFFTYRGDSSWLGYALIHGRWFHGGGEAVAPTAFMTSAHLNIGDVVAVTLPDRVVSLRIVGVILDQAGDNMLLRADWSNLPADVEANDYEVQLKTGTNADRYVSDVINALGPQYLYAESTQSSGVNSAFLLIDGVLVALALVLISIAAAGVFNTVLLNTREKARSIAILKAIGMTPRQTVTVVLASVIVLGAIGGLAGIPAGITMHHQVLQNMAQIASRTELPASFYRVFSPLLLSVMVVAGVLLAIMGAMLPAQWAARSRATAILHAE